ncbi:MAG TPA: hypothetical protein VFP65_11270 [Anaeromyxobacteraceae bacterium]|nr:hypothetical protein [Anaeromyxobacteraceae bacterium]
MPLEHHGAAGRYTAWLQLGERYVREPAGVELVRRVQTADLEHNEQVLLGLPRLKRAGGVTHGSAFWVVTEGKTQTARLERFWPQPSLVLRAGSSSRRWSFWPLNFELRWQGLWRGNRNLAYALGATMKHGDPDGLEFPAPGTCLREGRTRPVPVVVERLDVATFDPLGVIGRRHDGRRWWPVLREAPAPDAWMNAINGGRR